MGIITFVANFTLLTFHYVKCSSSPNFFRFYSFSWGFAKEEFCTQGRWGTSVRRVLICEDVKNYRKRRKERKISRKASKKQEFRKVPLNREHFGRKHGYRTLKALKLRKPQARDSLQVRRSGFTTALSFTNNAVYGSKTALSLKVLAFFFCAYLRTSHASYVFYYFFRSFLAFFF